MKLRSERTRKTEELRTRVIQFIQDNPEMRYEEVGEVFDRSRDTVFRYARDAGFPPRRHVSPFRRTLREAKQNPFTSFSLPLTGVGRQVEIARRMADEEEGRDKWIIESQQGRLWIIYIGDNPNDCIDRRQGKGSATSTDR